MVFFILFLNQFVGVETLAGGLQIEGYYENGVLKGFGKTRWPDGKIYEGEWENDHPHGKGTMKWPNGIVYSGIAKLLNHAAQVVLFMIQFKAKDK